MSILPLIKANDRDKRVTNVFSPDGHDDIPRMLLVMDIDAKGYNYSEYLGLKSDEEWNPAKFRNIEGWNVVFTNSSPTRKSCSAFIRTDNDVSIYMSWWSRNLNFFMASTSPESVKVCADIIKKVFPKATVKRNDDTVPISFWSLSQRGPTHRDKKIQPLMWPEIENNYTERTRAQVNTLRTVRPPMTGGRLILWHGPPGTGKSSAIRHLVWEWLPWCDTSYVVDPENFFGSADYMLSVLLDASVNNYEYEEDPDEDEDKNSADFILQGRDRWNLLIVEDADEFLRNDAKERTGQALSRLLNLADGLIGQGLNFMCLITTNAKINEIHEAVAREGRCLANIEFGKFNKGEATDWLGADSEVIRNDPGHTAYTLAQLYDKKRGLSQIKAEVEEFVPKGQYI